MKTLENILNDSLKNSIDYNTYKQIVNDLFLQGKATSMNDYEGILEYTKLGISRMKRLDKTTILSPSAVSKLQTLSHPVTWLVITEGWCGDAGQNIPVINKVAELSEHISLKIVFRDQNKTLMSHFLTNGGEAIPKLIQIENNVVTHTWGPRPSVATYMVNDFKAKHGQLTPEFKHDLQVWYNQDKGHTTVQDLLELLGVN